MIVTICMMLSILVGWWLGYSYFLTKVCTGCRAIPSKHNKSSTKCNHDMHWREQYICAKCGYVSISQPRGCGCTSHVDYYDDGMDMLQKNKEENVNSN